MGFLGPVTPAALDAGRTLSLVTMVVVIGVGYVPPLRPYAHRIRLAAAAVYILGALGFVAYSVSFR